MTLRTKLRLALRIPAARAVAAWRINLRAIMQAKYS
jgi:hypothetical protein